MKILFVVESYYPHVNGVIVATRYLAEALAKENEVWIFTESKGTLPAEDLYDGIPVRRFDVRYDILKHPVGKIDEFEEAVLNGKFDVVILECLQTATTDVVLNIADKLDCIKILHSHGSSGLDLRFFRFYSDLYHTVGNSVNYLIWKHYYRRFIPRVINRLSCTVSLTKLNSDYDYFGRISDVRRYVLSNAADDMFFSSEVENKLGMYANLKNNKYLISVANYAVVKNQILMLREYYKSETSKTCSLVFIGTKTNDYYHKVENAKKECDDRYGFRDVHLLHGVERKDFPGILRGAWAYICGSRCEAFSISLIEAMAEGVPVVSLDVGNARELPGCVVVNDPRLLHEELDRLEQNDELHNDLSEKGKKYAYENCQIESAERKMVKIIEEQRASEHSCSF